MESDQKKEVEEKFFKADAKSIVDMLFDNKLFREDLTRDDMDALENFVMFLLKSRFDSYTRGRALFERIKKSQEQKSANN